MTAQTPSQAKIAVVTGAGSGIGRLSALALLDAGWAVTLVGRRRSALEESLSLSKESAGSICAADITDEATVDTLFEQVFEAHGRLDLLFNNAGIFSGSVPFEQTDASEWRRMIDVNLTGAFLCARSAFRLMKRQAPSGGRIINNGSVSAHVPRPRAAAYTASKHAITGLTKAIALEGRPFNIACGQIDIGNAATDMTAGVAAGMLQADGGVRAEPVMDASEAVRAILHMASMPLGANIPFMTVMATTMPLYGRG
ncbi:SDR family oxidoreductase [Chelatococcus asaccharovorans]|uniref:SDR family oxidoreductase n=1 Tax=Chelatococcus asaccharovorans TaxID=28210 RepID=UPI00224C64BD|nr:SDR family oxidoreductase [Chelatococcus asaccharovorans]CAH1660179.1 NADP-dependent 3-hydroxy acid dehydrogenase YdfG [Chelatococcus asaccharovorans]CAH1683905.1 NADP-dependent 3-hydroxy acid dehydrogenase YdfG [Chelatococcus asaccharovorans]